MRTTALLVLLVGACRSSAGPQPIVAEADASVDAAVTVRAAPALAYPGLVSYLRLDEGAGALAMDSVATRTSGALAGGAIFVGGGFGKARFANPGALALDGVDGRVTLDPRPLPAPQAPKTISLWMYYLAYPPGVRTLVSLGGAGCGLTLGLRNNRLGAWSGGELISVLAPRSGWHHVVYTYDGKVNGLIVDGVVAPTTALPPQSCALDAAVLGNGPAGDQGFQGLLDDVRLYDRPLDDGEVGRLAAGDEPAVTAAYDGGSGLTDAATPDAPRPVTDAAVTGPLAVGLVGYWPLDERMGTATADLSGSGNEGVVMGSGMWMPAGFPAAKFSNPASLTLNGRPDQVVVGANRLGPVDGKLSVSLWFNYAAPPTTGNRTFFSFTNRNEACGIQIGTRGTNVVVWQWGGFVVAQTPAPLPGWHHLVYTFDGTTHALVLDAGAPVTTQAPPQSCVPSDAVIGNYQGGGEFFLGQIDDVRIWADRVLDAPSIAALYAGEQ
jgi:hypothetical protein